MIHGKLTNAGLVQEVLKRFYSPNLVFRNTYDEFQNLYCFIARIEPWDDEESPPEVNLSDAYFKQVHNNILAIKRINTTDISPVIERIDWEYGAEYVQYSSNTNSMFDTFLVDELNPNSKKLLYKFYVKNSYDQVFKCISNGTSEAIYPNGLPSLIEPRIDFSYDSSVGYIPTSDGYKWKYMFSIDAGSKLKFLDDEWIPVPVSSHRLDISQSSAGAGDIPVITVYNSGSGYTDDNGLGISTTISITGDGTGANAFAVISDNVVSQVLISNPGTNYTFASVEITPNHPYGGNSAVLIPEISPIGGHGFDLLNELGCRTVMVTAEFNSTEQGTLPGDIDYRQVGLLSNPLVKLNNTNQFANSYIYRLTHDVVISPGSGTYVQDEYVFQGADLENSTYTARVLNFDAINNILYLINISGTIAINDLIKGNDSKTLRVVSQETLEAIIPFSGNIDYIENRTKIQRTASGLEQFRLTINY